MKSVLSIFTGFFLLITCIACIACRLCGSSKYKASSAKSRLSESATSLTLSTATTVSVVEELKKDIENPYGRNSSPTTNDRSSKKKNKYPGAKVITPVMTDMCGETLKSIASVNSWMDSSGDSDRLDSSDKRRKKKSSKASTTFKLGRRLIALDLGTFQQEKDRRKKQRKLSLAANLTTDKWTTTNKSSFKNGIILLEMMQFATFLIEHTDILI